MGVENPKFQIPQGQSSNYLFPYTPLLRFVSNPIGTKFKFNQLINVSFNITFQIPQGQSSNSCPNGNRCFIRKFQIPQGQSSNSLGYEARDQCPQFQIPQGQSSNKGTAGQAIIRGCPFQIPQGQSSNTLGLTIIKIENEFQIPQGQSSNESNWGVIANEFQSFKSHRDKVQMEQRRQRNILNKPVSNPIGTKFKCRLHTLLHPRQKSVSNPIGTKFKLKLSQEKICTQNVSNPIGTKFKSK